MTGPTSAPSVTFDQPVRTISVIRALNLGDLLCAQPSLRAIRRRFPAARIRLIGLAWARVLVERWPDLLDEHEEFPGFPGIPEAPFDPARTLAAVAAAQRDPADLVVQLHGDGTTINAFAALLAGRSIAGFVPPGIAGLGVPEDGLWVPYPGRGSEIHRLLAIPRALGAPIGDDRLTFPVRPADVAALEALAGPDRLDRPYAVIHAGSSTPARRWPADRFAAVADVLAHDGLGIVLTGSAAERPIADAVRTAMRAPVLDLVGRTGLGELAALLEGARSLVVNDTGIAHVGAAVGVPSVVIFNGSDAERWAPLDRTLHVAVGAIGASSCQHEPGAPHRCLGDACSLDPRAGRAGGGSPATVEEVVVAARGLLARTALSSRRAG
jgi:ADP-heptose:LPS heptosyltransferase